MRGQSPPRLVRSPAGPPRGALLAAFRAEWGPIGHHFGLIWGLRGGRPRSAALTTTAEDALRGGPTTRRGAERRLAPSHGRPFTTSPGRLRATCEDSRIPDPTSGGAGRATRRAAAHRLTPPSSPTAPARHRAASIRHAEDGARGSAWRG
eukprot:scaffold5902_cov376-Prasinococcus_capsulatus_cf.AAC.5